MSWGRNVAIKESGFRTEFNRPSSKLFQRQKNTIPRFKKYFLQKMMDKKKGGVYRTEFTIIPTKFTYKITIPR